MAKPARKGACEPLVAFVIPAHNEERIIEKKIRNTLRLDYPKDKLQIVVASDGSTDGTNEIVARYCDQGVRLFEQKDRSGKTALLNRVIPDIEGEIVVLSDASGMANRDAVKEMVKNFSDPEVGCVCAEYRISEREKSDVDTFEQRYLSFETVLKKSECLLGTTLGGHGAFYAIRKELFEPLREEMINDDFLIPSHVTLKGFRTVYEEKAVLHDEITTSISDEFRRRVRISVGNWQQCYLLRKLLRSGMYAVAWGFVSHKVLRMFTPFLLIYIGIMSVFYDTLLYNSVQFAFALLALLALCGIMLHQRKGRMGFCKVFFYFLLENIAYIFGTYKFIFAKGKVAW